ncbi:MAG: hypothetical protein V2A73_16940 [Pseudomonadota bacterium]
MEGEGTMKGFVFNGKRLPYFQHKYNHASENVRTIEVPIARWLIVDKLRHNARARVLEVGNVLGHYGEIHWPVLDVREQGETVINADIMAWDPPCLLDLIVSISTIEHVGFERYAEYTGSGVTPAAVLARMRGWLAPGGRLLATAPTGYNPALDEELRNGTLGADRLWAMRRVSDDNHWAECNLDEALAMPYRDGKYRWGGGLVIMLCARSKNG